MIVINGNLNVEAEKIHGKALTYRIEKLFSDFRAENPNITEVEFHMIFTFCLTSLVESFKAS